MDRNVFVIILSLLCTHNTTPAEAKGSSGHDLIVRLYRRGSSLYLGEVSEPTEICDGSCSTVTFTKLSPEKPTVIIIHGWKGHGLSEIFKELVGGYLNNFDYNIITVDWSALGSKDKLYNHARNKVPTIANMVAIFLKSLIEKGGIKLENVHIIGHSLGAHIAGLAANQLGSGKIGRITGLDPAGPMFSLSKPAERLSVDSAKFVDVIHSSSEFLGIGGPIGHADFYPNGVRRLQPGCGIDVIGRCSHRRSYHFYAESLSRPQAFPAVPCEDWTHLKRRECFMGKPVPMGELTPATARGSYYLSTNSHSPFGRGVV